MESKQNVSWVEVYEWAGSVYRQIKSSKFVIVSIGAGGIWLGQYLQYRYYKDKGVILRHETVWTEKYAGMKPGTFGIVSEDKTVYGIPESVIICDDIEETGETLREVIKRFSASKDIRSAVLVQRANTRVASYVGYKTPGKEYVVFPWERFAD